MIDSVIILYLGDCPAGWFQAGIEEFKSCFLYVGAVMPYTAAVEYCQVRSVRALSNNIIVQFAFCRYMMLSYHTFVLTMYVKLNWRLESTKYRKNTLLKSNDLMDMG